jgi:hypothetical protein
MTAYKKMNAALVGESLLEELISTDFSTDMTTSASNIFSERSIHQFKVNYAYFYSCLFFLNSRLCCLYILGFQPSKQFEELF